MGLGYDFVALDAFADVPLRCADGLSVETTEWEFSRES